MSPSHTEILADEVAAELEGFPDGMPPLRPIIALPRPSRADVMDAFANVIDQIEWLQAAASSVDSDPDRPKDDAGKAAWVGYAEHVGASITKSMSKPDIIKAVDAHLMRNPGIMAAMTRRVAQIARLAQSAVDALVPAAEDPDEFRAWADEQSDMDMITLLSKYGRKFQAPEASRSAT
jgi:hypothetical protein